MIYSLQNLMKSKYKFNFFRRYSTLMHILRNISNVLCMGYVKFSDVLIVPIYQLIEYNYFKFNDN